MRNFVLLYLLILGISAFAEKEISTNLKSVTVSLSGAQVFREGEIIYQKGINKIIIDNVSPDIKKEGIQAKSLGNYKIMDVKHQLKYPEPLKVKPSIMPERIHKEINLLNDSIFYATQLKENFQMKIQTINKQKSIINNNKLTTGTGRSDSLPVLKGIVEYYQQKLFQLEDELMAFNIKYRRLKQNMNKMNTRLRELQNFNKNVNQPTIPVKIIHQIEVTIYAEQKGTSKIDINYLVTNAGWYPAYDLRVDGTDTPLAFTYKAYVYQNTKEDWDNINISLVTYDSRINNEKPILPSWIVDYHKAPPKQNGYRYKKKEAVSIRKDYSPNNEKILANSNLAISTSESLLLETVEENEDQQFNILQAHSVSSNELLSNFSFEIELPYTIKSDNKEVLIIVNDQEIEADYKHYIVPKLDTKAYLMASVPNWESMNLLTGKTNLYFAKSYLGNTILDPATLDDTLAIDLGADRAIFCKRTKIKDTEKCKIIGNKRTQQVTIEIVLKNNKNTEVSIEMEDQVPVTKNLEIEIDINDKGKGELNPETGKLIWDIKLKPQEKKIIQFTYTIKHDKHKKII